MTDGPIYLAGPMSGIPQFNFPAFDAAATALRAAGFYIASPAELDDPDTRAAALASPSGDIHGLATGESWSDFLSRDVKVIADGAAGVATLRGWERSRGARLEVFVARLCDLPVYRYLPPVPGLDPRRDPQTPANLTRMFEFDILHGITQPNERHT